MNTQAKKKKSKKTPPLSKPRRKKRRFLRGDNSKLRPGVGQVNPGRGKHSNQREQHSCSDVRQGIMPGALSHLQVVSETTATGVNGDVRRPG